MRGGEGARREHGESDDGKARDHGQHPGVPGAEAERRTGVVHQPPFEELTHDGCRDARGQGRLRPPLGELVGDDHTRGQRENPGQESGDRRHDVIVPDRRRDFDPRTADTKKTLGLVVSHEAEGLSVRRIGGDLNPLRALTQPAFQASAIGH